MIVVHWAQRHRRPIRGALLATPPDFESPLPEGYPSLERAAARTAGCRRRARRLPFPSIVAASTNDPLGTLDRVARSPAHGAAASSTSATSVISIRRPAMASGRGRSAHPRAGLTGTNIMAGVDVSPARCASPAGAATSAARGRASAMHRHRRSPRRSSRIIAAGRRCSTRCSSAWRSTPSPSRASQSPVSISPRGSVLRFGVALLGRADHSRPDRRARLVQRRRLVPPSSRRIGVRRWRVARARAVAAHRHPDRRRDRDLRRVGGDRDRGRPAARRAVRARTDLHDRRRHGAVDRSR